MASTSEQDANVDAAWSPFNAIFVSSDDRCGPRVDRCARAVDTGGDGGLRHNPSSAGLAQLVERRLPKPKVAGSRPVSRSDIIREFRERRLKESGRRWRSIRGA
jgi:hypothetical protein